MAINVNKIERSDVAVGPIVSFWVDSGSDIGNLPTHGESITLNIEGVEMTIRPALTSIAFVKPTGTVYALGINGWEVIG